MSFPAVQKPDTKKSALNVGGYLLSPSKGVPSVLGGLTSVFGMGTGGPLPPNHQR